MSRFAEFPNLGVGIGFREPFLSELFLHREDVDFVEIVADHYLDASREKRRELDLLANHFPIIPHTLDLSLGSAEGIDEDYLNKLAELINHLQPPWWSEHIAFTRAGGVPIGHLSPLPTTHESIETLCRNIDHVRSRIDTPLILENITYIVQFPYSEMDEAAFLTEVLERTDCGLLLDVTNLFTNSTNHCFDALAFLDRLPMERIVQLHFAGGHWHDGTLIDSHSQPAPAEVWSLMEQVLERFTVQGVILERDKNLPPFENLIDELKRVRHIGKAQRQWV
ncbi:hypothetical protein CA54_58250 [Symmachiella macrocystis]|uniref:DUF692 domain-containing protein n=1 Tax=Symmachiella macrocystis TaxID=2527985 RepID=A0A5C6B037_9PLAN|nr:DUF692 domain-containing protein [Symmachiella macrocystis]TWU05137.1 hypothetical protein CA54_58250 [Symmachiella macrocystis]